MVSIGNLTFLEPLAFVGVLILAIIWWFLRLVPPAPKTVKFSAVSVLEKISQASETSILTPPWLLLLRILLILLLILAAAHPVLKDKVSFKNDGPVFIIIDNDWASAKSWKVKKEIALEIVDKAEQDGKSVVLITAADVTKFDPNAEKKPTIGGEVRERIKQFKPKPWPLNRKKLADYLIKKNYFGKDGEANLFWLSNGLGTPEGLEGIFNLFKGIGPITFYANKAADLPIFIRSVTFENNKVIVSVERFLKNTQKDIYVKFLDSDGQLLFQQKISFEQGKYKTSSEISLPNKVLNQTERIELENQITAGGVYLVDKGWRPRVVGFLSNETSLSTPRLLSDVHYIKKAFEPFAQLKTGSLEELFKSGISILVLTDSESLDVSEVNKISIWVERGGLLLRFAGGRLAKLKTESKVSLLPVTLQEETRLLGGSMSWSQPATLAPFEEGSPFFGLAIPEEIRIRRQVLARPSIGLGKKIWAKLVDGTPLVTAKQREQGWIVLFHITGNVEWSDLPISGLFLDMLHRIADLSTGRGNINNNISLTPLALLNGLGILERPKHAANTLPSENLSEIKVSKVSPPGFYGAEDYRFALNLSESIPSLKPIIFKNTNMKSNFYQDKIGYDFRLWLLIAAILLFFIDTVVSLKIRRIFNAGRIAGYTGMFLVLSIINNASANTIDDKFALENSLETRLAYVETGDKSIDMISRQGLAGLNFVLHQRTAAELGKPQSVLLDKHELSFFPLIYWPVTDRHIIDYKKAAPNVKKYLKNGGTILFDTRDHALMSGDINKSLKAIAQQLDLPPLDPISKDHVLSRSFYLLKTFPGRWRGGKVWVERSSINRNDGVSPIVIGGNDWAGAWAINELGQPLFPVVPGGERQRELAYRFGINIVMYTLTGNYKGDQVHLPSILERLGQ